MNPWPFQKSPTWDEVIHWAPNLKARGPNPSDQIFSLGDETQPERYAFLLEVFQAILQAQEATLRRFQIR